ncbi:MAG: hypothetical protein OXH75_11320 [Acidobacteria bacterium]|nr:hypothetical protein [Acidobacteriota bacterium]
MATLDTHAIARSLTDAGADPKLADAITAAVRQVADRDTDALATKADLAALEARLYRAMLLQGGAIVGAVVAILRMLGDGQ